MPNVASGMAINDDCKLRFSELKSQKIHRFVVYKIDEQSNQVIVDKLGTPDQSYEDLAKSLPNSECRYAVFDFDFIDSDNSQKNKTVFIAWSPDASNVRDKMLYASTKDRFKKELDGIQVDLQATEPCEMSMEIVKERATTTATN